MEEFAQTRAPDDLFDDDFTPLPNPSPHPQRNQQGTKSNFERRPQNIPNDELTSLKTSNPDVSACLSPAAQSNSALTAAQVPLQPRIHTPVRGDRHLTGGLAKPKLTEEELSAKLAAARLNNERRAEAHRLAEADEASFQQREAKANMRRREEGRARRVMDMERERNRVRKLKGMDGREWDEGKEEQSGDKSGQHWRDLNGGVRSGGGRVSGYYRGRGDNIGADQRRGGHGSRGRGRGGRGRGDGQHGSVEQRPIKVEQRVPDPQQDFPPLAQTIRPQKSHPLPPDKVEESLKMKAGELSWADQVTEAKQS
ncbi:MAG: hypothetical protein Q9163_005972 [Psora crenata]